MIIEQQQKDRMAQPYRNHEKDRQRSAMAPAEVKRLEIARQRRFEAARVASDEAVEENRQKAAERHQQWVAHKRNARARTVKRIEAANREKTARTEENAAAVRRFDENFAKLEAKKALRDERLRLERETFRRQQSDMQATLYKSQVGADIITDAELEAAVFMAKK